MAGGGGQCARAEQLQCRFSSKPKKLPSHESADPPLVRPDAALSKPPGDRAPSPRPRESMRSPSNRRLGMPATRNSPAHSYPPYLDAGLPVTTHPPSALKDIALVMSFILFDYATSGAVSCQGGVDEGAVSFLGEGG